MRTLSTWRRISSQFLRFDKIAACVRTVVLTIGLQEIIPKEKETEANHGFVYDLTIHFTDSSANGLPPSIAPNWTMGAIPFTGEECISILGGRLERAAKENVDEQEGFVVLVDYCYLYELSAEIQVAITVLALGVTSFTFLPVYMSACAMRSRCDESWRLIYPWFSSCIFRPARDLLL